MKHLWVGLLLVLSGGCKDVNRDGVFTIGCVGDSNTAVEGPPQITRWCEQLAASFTEAVVINLGWPFNVTEPVAWVNVAVPGAKACQHGVQQIEAIPNADLILIALGTNDFWRQRDLETALACFEAMRAALGKRDWRIALIPPTYPPARDSNAGIDATNALIQRLYPSRWVDFHDGFTGAMFEPDGIHLNQAGQALRAQRALAALQ